MNFIQYSDDSISVNAETSEGTPTVQFAAVTDRWWILRGNVYNRIVQAVLYCAAVLVPLLYLPLTSNVLEYNKQLLLIVVASVGLITWLLGVVASGKLAVRTTLLDKGVLGLLLATVVATACSMARVTSLFGISGSLSASLVSVLAFTLFYFLAVNTLQDRGRTLRHLLTASIGVALLLGVLQLISIYFLPGSFTHSRAFNTVGSINALGVLAAIALPLFTKLGRHTGRWVAVLRWVGIASALFLLAVLNWWVLWVVALAGMLATIAFDSMNATQLAEDYRSARNRFALSRFIVPIVVIVIGAFLLLVGFTMPSIRSNLATEVAPSYSLSLHITQGALGSRLLTGWGPENFSVAFDRFGASALAETQLASARFFDGTSEAVTFVVVGGVLMALALLFALWCLVQVVARFGRAIIRPAGREEVASWASESSGTLAATIALTVAFFLYPFGMTLLFVWFALLALAGLAVADRTGWVADIERRPLYSLSASLGFIIALILLLSGVYFSTIRYIADVRYARALTTTDPTVAMDALGSALNLESTNDQYLRGASQVELVLLQRELDKGSKADAQRAQNLVTSAIQLAQRATSAAPDEALNWSNLGMVYQSLSGLVDNVERLAQDAYSKASTLRPGDPTYENIIGQVWLARANFISSTGGLSNARLKAQYDDALVNAAEAFKKAISTSPTYGLALYNLGAVYDRQGQTNDAIAQLEKIVPYNANNPTLLFELGLLYVRANRHTDALTVLQQAIILAPQYANARWYVALLLEEKGDIDGAVAQLNSILETNPDNQMVKDKIAQLEAGKRAIPPAKVIDSKPIR